MNYKLEDYINERINVFDKSVQNNKPFIDADSVKTTDSFDTDYSKMDYLISELDKKFINYFDNTFILYKKNELDKWTPYLLKTINQ